MDAAILTSVFQNRVLFNYALVGSFMLSVADHFQTFAREVRLVWPKQRSIIKFLYLYTRYSPWIYGPMMINKDVAVTLKFGQCAGHTTASSLINMSTIVAAEAIMFVRVYAICGKNRTLLFWLIFQFIAIHVAAYVFLSIFLTSFVFFPTPLPTHMACFPVASDTQKLVYVYVLIIVSEFIIMLISLFGFWKFRAANSQLFKTLRQDGILYFFALVAISFANILFDVAVPDQSLRFILSIPQTALHSVLSCRLVLHLYEVSEKKMVISGGSGGTSGSGSYPMRPTIQFAKPSGSTKPDLEWNPASAKSFPSTAESEMTRF